MAIEREVAGMRCGEVLAELSEYLDGELVPERRTQVETHLRGCDVCERFGGVFTAAIHALRQGGPGPSPEEPAIFERLRARMREAAKG